MLRGIAKVDAKKYVHHSTLIIEMLPGGGGGGTFNVIFVTYMCQTIH
jgi:hypothetical protein